MAGSAAERSTPEDETNGVEAQSAAGSVDCSIEPSGELTRVPQPHGGALYRGGVRGNRGGPGTVPSDVRRAARQGFYERLPVLFAIADGEVRVPIREKCPKCGHEATADEERDAIRRAPSPGEQVRAMAALARAGLAGSISADEIRVRMQEQVRLTRGWTDEHGLSRELSDDLLATMGLAWQT